MVLKTGSTSASSRTMVQHGSNRVVQLPRPAHNGSLYCFRNLQRCRKLEGIVAASVVQHGIEVQEELQKVVQHGSESSGATAAAREQRPVEEQVAALNTLNIGFECRDSWAPAQRPTR